MPRIGPADRHSPQVIETEELSNPEYQKNAPDRCYHCKTELFTRLEAIARQMDVAVVADGSNWDDHGEHRPGLQAARDRKVRSPLAECGLTKAEIRTLALHWGLPTWDKPAMPCLSSRIAYGESVTPERLAMIDKAERFLRDRGFKPLRVRYHKGDVVRIEVRPMPGEVRRAAVSPRSDRALQGRGIQVRHARSGRIPLGEPERGHPGRESADPPCAAGVANNRRGPRAAASGPMPWLLLGVPPRHRAEDRKQDPHDERDQQSGPHCEADNRAHFFVPGGCIDQIPNDHQRQGVPKLIDRVGSQEQRVKQDSVSESRGQGSGFRGSGFGVQDFLRVAGAAAGFAAHGCA